MKIVFTVNTYAPLKDGVQAVTQYHAEGLAQRGHEVVVITGRPTDTKEREVLGGVEIIRVPVYTEHTIHRGDKQAYQALVKTQCENADVLINVCTQIVFTDWVLPILPQISCKKVLYMHGMFEFKWHKNNIDSIKHIVSKLINSIRWGTYYKMVPKYMKQYDQIIHLHESDDAYCYCQKKGLDKCLVLENAAEDCFFDEKIEKAAKPYMICISNYTPIKNQEFVLKAFYESGLIEESLVFMGSSETPYLNELIALQKQLESRYGKKKVAFLHDVPRNQVVHYLKGAKLFVTGSRWEAFPIVIIESMAAGVPFICTDVGCVKYLPGGIIVKKEKEMAYWMSLLLSNQETAVSLGEAGRHYALDHMRRKGKTAELEAALLDLIGKTSR